MPRRVLPAVKISRRRKPARRILPAPFQPAVDSGEPEVLSGTVQDREASAPEERLFKALYKIGIFDAQFRYTVGAPRGLPGWKEVDALVPRHGLVYAVEVDTEFTHQDKQRADVLHDAIVLRELEKQGMNVFPRVIHLDGESDLVDNKWALATVKHLFE